MAAAARAEADQFIATLEDPKGRKGYNAHVGERGVKLSGGQRQRLTIARALLKNSPILILDEATSAVDPETETALERALERLALGRTTVSVAHRLSTVRDADQIIVLDQGRLVEQGTHQTLLQRGGLYAQLYSMNFQDEEMPAPAPATKKDG
mgnify:CR=1 FL=1